jgi:hypothetical protein
MDSNHRSPARKSRFLLRKANLRDRTGAAKKGCFLRGTDGSNPSPASGESLANLARLGGLFTTFGGRNRGSLPRARVRAHAQRTGKMPCGMAAGPRAEKIRVMEEMEQVSDDEMRNFLITNDRARLIM